MAELANCIQCGKVFVTQHRELCPECYRAEEKAYKKVYDFLRQRKNREATTLEVVEATGVTEELIIKFIKEKRLRPSMFPKLGYPCERCGSYILTGKICFNCSMELKKELKQLEEIEKIQEKNADPLKKDDTYYILKKHER